MQMLNYGLVLKIALTWKQSLKYLGIHFTGCCWWSGSFLFSLPINLFQYWPKLNLSQIHHRLSYLVNIQTCSIYPLRQMKLVYFFLQFNIITRKYRLFISNNKKKCFRWSGTNYGRLLCCFFVLYNKLLVNMLCCWLMHWLQKQLQRVWDFQHLKNFLCKCTLQGLAVFTQFPYC